ncbi:MAG: aminotransferase class I/II-fold pyridoxal phosphate-dependent enzyme [Pseudomonadota bacterium]|nr:aminotransferase class I/II-fold pyridoxal phosphate-dependent enzyme [Pseudomonadota bacterium]
MQCDTICVHGGDKPELVTGAVTTPIFQTSTYVQDAPGKPRVYDYARAGNPTRTALEEALAAIEQGGKHAITFASGLAATQAIVQLLDSGDRVLVCEDVYGGTGRMFDKLFAKYGIEFIFVDMRNVSAVAELVNAKTRMFWIESPTNPLLHVIDIAALTALAKQHDILTVVDNTFASPLCQSPLQLGADLVLHSTTKYIGGHSDLVGGAVITADDHLAERLKFLQFAAGAVNAPIECYLLLRSLKTLAVRMQKHQHNAMMIAQALEQEQAFSAVVYPGLPSHPQHALASQQMVNGFSGIISLRLRGGKAATYKFMQNLKLIKLAESLGGVESLINHPETMTHASVPAARRKTLGITSDLVRLSVGIENHADLLADIRASL